jgi:pimeloyl-ACP methyl ester carboxylesterase
MTTRPNILLVHGAWGDGSHWRHAIPSLHAKGYRVRAVQNPLTSLADDVDRTRKLAASLDGPTLLVGHSYGGSVITGAGRLPNVVGLVYVAAWAPDEARLSAASSRCANRRPVQPSLCRIRMAFCGCSRRNSAKTFVRISTRPRRW